MQTIHAASLTLLLITALLTMATFLATIIFAHVRSRRVCRFCSFTGLAISFGLLATFTLSTAPSPLQPEGVDLTDEAREFSRSPAIPVSAGVAIAALTAVMLFASYRGEPRREP